ncbi:DUF1796 family putative cysteine peptidase [Pararhizobium sp. LjRoot235]|uniref:DUF1796 family putative cysteine peptidase n=1 Tax=Pararhizobium sp. LjRoot235 TaxID=3342291 RepID=UPI003ECE1AC5
MVTYLSLGLNCQPIMHAIENRLVPDRAGGRLTSVFDLCLTTTEALCHFIQTEFTDFFNDISLISNPKGDFNSPTGELLYSFVGDASYGDLIVNTKHGMIFNHESPGHPFLATTESWGSQIRFCQNDFHEFRERYARRIEAFLSTIKHSIANNREIVFLMRVNPDDGRVVANAIKAKFPELKFKIKVSEFLDIDRIVNSDMQNFFYGSSRPAVSEQRFLADDLVFHGWA